MTSAGYDRESWEQRWARVLRDHPEKVASRAPSAHLLAEVDGVPAGRALDAGCGHGAEAIWLATAGWQVTAVDFSTTALEIARSTAEAIGADVAGRIEWVEGDLGRWTPPPHTFDLVSCLYVHVEDSVVEMVRRLGSGVAPDGSLVLVGHLPVDPATGKPTSAAAQVQVTVDEAVEALDPRVWDVMVAEERPRAVAGTGVDAVVRAVHRPGGGAEVTRGLGTAVPPL